MSTAKKAPLIDEDDVRGMVRLLGEVAALPGGHAEKKRYLMDGLCKLIDADAWAWTLACQYEAGKPPVYVGFMHGGFTEERFAKYLSAVEHSASSAMTAPFIAEMRDRQTHITRTIGQINRGRFERFSDDTTGFEAAHLWSEAQIGTLLLSARPIDAQSASGIGIYRRPEAAAFDERERLLAHIVLSEVPWLHALGWPEDRGADVPRLSPRTRLVLELLLQSYSRKQIAAHLGISENTVAGYVKEIYRHFSVHTQAELMRRFLHGDGGDRA